MKNTTIWSALFATLLCTQIHAEVTQQATPSKTANTSTIATPSDKTSPTPSLNQTTPIIQTTTESQQKLPTLPAQPTNQNQTIQQIPPVHELSAQPINCDYKIPAETKKIDPSLVMTWAENASVQSFSFDPMSIDTQIQKLQACFTEQGWTGFNSALLKSGNIEAIKSQKLTVSSQINGQNQITESKDNQWKITLPLEVVYQNDKEKLTQLLDINLTIGRKISGDLGIMQMVATPRIPVTTKPTQANTSAATPTTPGTAPSSTPNATTPTASTTGTVTPSTSIPTGQNMVFYCTVSSAMATSMPVLVNCAF